MKTLLFDKEWLFCGEDLRPRDPSDGWSGAKAGACSLGAAAKALDDRTWETVDLPHDSVHEGEFVRDPASHDPMDDIPAMESIRSRLAAGGSLIPRVCWYRKHFTLGQETRDRRVLLFFEGIYRKADLYLNEYYVGSTEGGYTGSCFDLTDFLEEPEEENILCVRVDPTGREGWWYEGGGIYRHVHLLVCGDVFMPPYGLGITPQIRGDGEAQAELRVRLRNGGVLPALGTLDIRAADPEGKIVGQCRMPFRVDALSEAELQTVLPLSGPVQRWDLDRPNLYTLRGSIACCVGEGTEQTESLPETVFGIRTADFRRDGFFLNGRRVPIRGMCIHQDHAGVGIAVLDSVLEYRLRELRKMGMNAIRCAHHQPSDRLLELCDRMGILVMSECRRMSSAETDLAHLKKTVLQGRNHPSVILWGIGNEEINVMDRPRTRRTVKRMKAEIAKLDARPVTVSHVCWDGKIHYDDPERVYPVTSCLDVMGFNYSISAWDRYHADFPDQPVLITEINAANSSTRGVFETDQGKGHFFTLDPDNAVKCPGKRVSGRFERGERDYMAVLERDWLCGAFIWTGMDYRGEPTPLSWPAVSSQFGILDLCGFPKDSFWFYKAIWSDEDVMHLFPHWNRPGREGERFSLYAYTNAEKAELFINGKSMGEGQKKDCGYMEWPGICYEPGTVMAVGVRKGHTFRESMETTGPAVRVEAVIYPENRWTSGDAVIVNVHALDAQGRFVPDACPELKVTVGPGTVLVGHGNGDPGCHDRETGSTVRLFNGRCQLIFKCGGTPSFQAALRQAK